MQLRHKCLLHIKSTYNLKNPSNERENTSQDINEMEKKIIKNILLISKWQFIELRNDYLFITFNWLLIAKWYVSFRTVELEVNCIVIFLQFSLSVFLIKIIRRYEMEWAFFLFKYYTKIGFQLILIGSWKLFDERLIIFKT